MTSAPISASSMEPKGPAPYCSTAMTLTPLRGSTFGAPSDRIVFDQAFGDHQTLDLVGAFADHQQRRVAVQPFHHEFFGIAVAAVNAHAFQRILDGGFGG